MPRQAEQMAAVGGIKLTTDAVPQYLTDALDLALEQGASDVHIAPQRPLILRVGGRLVEFGETWTDGDTEQAAEVLTGIRPDQYDAEAVFAHRSSRLRCASFRQRDGVSSAVRFLPARPIPFSKLGLPPQLLPLVDEPAGLVLVCGATGSGKSTSLASMLDIINSSQQKHIITIEDPVEYKHPKGAGLVQQREIHHDADSFSLALRSALRQDPDIVLVGEMRDLETIGTSLQAAETGHLVFSTVHANDFVSVIQRIIDVFPDGRQQQTRVQLASTLRAVVCQKILPRVNGGRVVVCEIAMMNTAMAAAIRDNNLHQLPSYLQGSVKEGSQPFELGLARAVKAGLIEKTVAHQMARDEAGLARYMQNPNA